MDKTVHVEVIQFKADLKDFLFKPAISFQYGENKIFLTFKLLLIFRNRYRNFQVTLVDKLFHLILCHIINT